ncbi:MAG: TolC family protein, partial [Bacteroidales bacterium]|nr:TolC family protein [Bacteroidales bacterium]
MKKTLSILLILITSSVAMAQRQASLDEVISIARHQSVEALEARQAFISTYWAYRSYQASRLPSVYLQGNLMNFDRSLTLLQNPDNGSLNYESSNN